MCSRKLDCDCTLRTSAYTRITVMTVGSFVLGKRVYHCIYKSDLCFFCVRHTFSILYTIHVCFTQRVCI